MRCHVEEIPQNWEFRTWCEQCQMRHPGPPVGCVLVLTAPWGARMPADLIGFLNSYARLTSWHVERIEMVIGRGTHQALLEDHRRRATTGDLLYELCRDGYGEDLIRSVSGIKLEVSDE